MRGARGWIYSNSLALVMGALWLGSWFAQSVTGWSGYSADTEFLAVGSMAVLAVYLRQRGSPESKPVGAPHSATGVEG